MKNSLIAIALISIFAACNAKTEKTAQNTIQKDSLLLDSLARLNDQSEIIDAKGIPDTFVTSDGTVFAKVQPLAETEANSTQANPRSTKTTSRKSPGSSSGGGSGTSNTGSATSGNTGTTASTTPQKKGWSKAAKGTVIGAGAGAVTGAIISKKKGKGAVIGGLIGAGGGYIIGRKEDKKDGRVQ